MIGRRGEAAPASAVAGAGGAELVGLADEFRGPSPCHAGRVRGYVGRMGAGKSYSAVRDALGVLRTGGLVCSNGALVNPYSSNGSRVVQFSSWEQFVMLRDCHVLLDEAHLWAPSWDPKALPWSVRAKIAHLRKFGVSLTWVTQHEDRISTSLRQASTEIVVMSVLYLGVPVFKASHYEPEHVRQHKASVLRRWYRFDRRVASAFDSQEVYEIASLRVPDDQRELWARAVAARRSDRVRNP